LRSRSRAFLWLLNKECRELIVSRAWWVLLLIMGPLVGMSFIGSVRTYAEVSGLNGGSAGVGEALSPLIGVWAPTFSACELAAVFLLPFVVIRLVAGDRESGALKLELQQGMSMIAVIAAKGLVLMAGWLVAMLPPLSAILLWKSYGGSVYAPELIALIAGHLLNAGLTIGLAAALAALTEHHSTAAILTLGVTVGTWVISFLGSVQGGWWERAAEYTPAAMVSEFQHGLVRLDVILTAIVITLTGLGLAAIWMRLGMSVRQRIYESGSLGILAAVAILACTFVNANWDASESRGNSFPEADERMLRQIHAPLRVEVHLAPEDPRRMDLENHALSKLRRIMPKLQVSYLAATSIGLFEQANSGYGEIWYEIAGRRTMSRATTVEGVLEAIYSVASMAAPVETDESIFRGHPLAVPPKGASVIFYAVWPGLFLMSAILARRKLR
jgi:ABC-2 type transport system permease protein